MRSTSRRDFLKSSGAAAVASVLPGCASPGPSPKSAGRVVVIGGGYGGATASRYLRMWSGGAIEVEIYELSVEAFGSFVTEIPAPLAMGTVTLESGEEIKGFVDEPRAMHGAQDVTHFGGWRAYLAEAAGGLRECR